MENIQIFLTKVIMHIKFGCISVFQSILREFFSIGADNNPLIPVVRVYLPIGFFLHVQSVLNCNINEKIIARTKPSFEQFH